MRKAQPFSYRDQFLFVLSFTVAPYLQLKKNLFVLYLIFERFTTNADSNSAHRVYEIKMRFAY